MRSRQPRHIGPDHYRHVVQGGGAVRHDTVLVYRSLALCAALALAASCGGSGTGEDDDGLPAAPTGVTATAGSSTSVHVMWNAVSATPRVSVYEVYRGTTEVEEVPASQHMVDVTRLRPS